MVESKDLRKWQPTPILLPGKFHGWKSLVGYRPWGHKESDMTKWLQFTKRKKQKKIILIYSVQFSSVAPVVSDSLRPHELQNARPPCPSPTPGVHLDSCPSSQWCHPAISSSVVPFSSCPQPLPASESFPMSQLFAWGGQSTRVSASASVLPMNIQDSFPVILTKGIGGQA